MDWVYRFVNRVGRIALGGLGLDIGWTGIEHVPSSGPVLFASNHVGYLDFVVIERAAVERGRYVRFLTRHDIWDLPAVGWFMDRMRHVPVDRAAPAYAYLRARELLRTGEAVGVFPEAGISYSYTIRPLMRGTMALARETGAPVVPLAVWGTQRVAGVGIPEPRPDLTRGRKVDLAFGPPLYVARGADLTEATRDLGQRLTGQLECLQRRPEHQPRPGEYAAWHPAHLGGQAPRRQVALGYDVVPAHAVLPTWGPDLDAYER